MKIRGFGFKIELVKIGDSLYKAIIRKEGKLMAVEAVSFKNETNEEFFQYAWKKIYQYA